MSLTFDNPAAAAPRHFRIVALVIASALFMEQLDGTVLVTALPTMARALATTAPRMSTALTSYLLTLAIFVPASGWIADRVGAKRTFLAAIAAFTLGSILCAQAVSLPMLTFTRVLQGLGGAMMIPVSRLVLLRSVRREDMVAAMSWLLVPALLGPIFGPPLGALIMDWLGWRWIFYINVPVGIVGAILIGLVIEDVREDHDVPPFDLKGFVLSAVGLGCLFLGFEGLGRGDPLIQSLALLAAGFIGGGLYIVHARGRRDAILDLSLLRIPTFRLSQIAGSLTRITQGAQPFLLALMLQIGFGLSPLRSGATLVATAFGALAMKALAPAILRRVGFRTGLTAGGILAAGVYMICAFFRPAWPDIAILAVLFTGGLCMSLQFSGYNAIAFDGVERARTGAAMAFHTTFQQLTLSVGVSVGASILGTAMGLRGEVRPSLGDFSVALLIVSAITLSATLWNLRFAPDAGHNMSGHKVSVSDA